MSKPRPVFSSNRFVALFVVLAVLIGGGLAAIAASYDLLQTYGLSPGDGGVLKPLSERIAMAGFIFSLGLLCLAGGIICMYRYVISIHKVGKSEFAVHTLGMLGMRTLELPLENLRLGKRQEGRGRYPSGHSVDAPYRLLRVAGRRIPFILDLQGQIHDRRALAELIRNAEH